MLDLLARDVVPLNRGDHPRDLRGDLFHNAPETLRRPAQLSQRRIDLSQRLLEPLLDARKLLPHSGQPLRQRPPRLSDRLSPPIGLLHQLAGVARHRLREVVQLMRQVLKTCAHLSQPRYLDVGQHPQHPGLAHDRLLPARQLREPFQQLLFGNDGVQHAGGGLQPAANEGLRRGCQFLHPRQHRRHALAFGAADDHACRLKDRVRFPGQGFKIVAQPFHLSLRLGQQRAQLVRNPAQNRVRSFFPGDPTHAAALGRSCLVAYTQHTLLPQRRGLSLNPCCSGCLVYRRKESENDARARLSEWQASQPSPDPAPARPRKENPPAFAFRIGNAAGFFR